MQQFRNTKFVVNEIIVHSGNFHADDVFCVAAMQLINPNVDIKRIANVNADMTSLTEDIIMADIGGGRFDHHQNDIAVRDDGIRHCAFSQLWLDAGFSVVKAIDNEVADEDVLETTEAIYNSLIRTIAAEDNGIDINPGKLYSIGNAISSFIPGAQSKRSIEECFDETVRFAKRILENEILSNLEKLKAKAEVISSLSRQQNGIVILDRYVPWEKTVCEDPNARAVIFFSNREEYTVQLVPVAEGSFITRWNVPENWKGKRGEDAENVQNGMIFCHINGFLSCYKTKDDAIEAANYLYWWNTHRSDMRVGESKI